MNSPIRKYPKDLKVGDIISIFREIMVITKIEMEWENMFRISGFNKVCKSKISWVFSPKNLITVRDSINKSHRLTKIFK